MLEQLVNLAPMCPQYHAELAYNYRTLNRMKEARAEYESTRSFATFSEEDSAEQHWRAAANRGIGYILIDEGKWDKAAKAYRESLNDDPDSDGAKSELDYIRQNKPK